MKKMTRLLLISAVLATSGLTAKIATENYKAGATNDERIHKAYELAKKPNKAAVLEAIVAAANAEPDERIQNAVVIEPDEPKTPRVVQVTTSAGVSPIASVMDKKTVNKAEEFIEKIAHPATVVMEKNLDFTTENISIQEIVYETKDIFPTFEETEKESPLTHRIALPEKSSSSWPGVAWYFFDVNGNGENEDTLNCINFSHRLYIGAYPIKDGMLDNAVLIQVWDPDNNATNIVKLYPNTRTIDYSALVDFKDSNEQIDGTEHDSSVPTYKEVYDFLVGVEKGKYPLLEGI